MMRLYMYEIVVESINRWRLVRTFEGTNRVYLISRRVERKKSFAKKK